MTRRRDVLLGASLALAAALAHLPALWTDFTADDFFILARLQQHGGLVNPLAYFQFGFFDYFRPLGFLSQAVDYRVWGLNATGFHLTNVLLHAGSTGLVYALGRRVAGVPAAALGATFFGLAAGTHEAVYWMAARFDLLATLFTLLAVLGATLVRPAAYWIGVVSFGLALLSKESAIAVLVVVTAHFVLVGRRSWQATLLGIAPFVAVAVSYAVLRSLSADLAVAGGRMPKLVLLALALIVLCVVAWAGADRVRQRIAEASLTPAGATLAMVPAGVALLALAGLRPEWLLEKLGFVAYATFNLASPLVYPQPPGWLFVPEALASGVPGALAVVTVVAAIWVGRRWLFARAEAVWLLAFVVGALLPVLSLVGGLRYLYLASAGVSLLAGMILEAAARSHRSFVASLVGLWVVASVVQLGAAGRAWQWAGDMTREAVDVMADTGPGCADRDLVMLTAPAGIRGVYPNLLWDALAVRTPCPPATIATLLRVVGTDAIVEATQVSTGVVDLRVPEYAGQFVTSRDQIRFGVVVPEGATMNIETTLGRIETWPEAGAQRFRVTMVPGLAAADLFVYGDGRLRALAGAR